jgi:ABC-type lipoprotein export system ATPase subunit
MEHQIAVKKYLSEEKEQILDIIAQIIENKDKIHVKAPVGSGKTTLILELIQLYPDKRFIILFPQISITEQVKTKLTNLNIEASVINSGTIKKAIIKNTDEQVVAKDRVFLTTIDSAYKLIDAIEFEDDKTVVVVDETHTLLTNARKDHTRSVNTILKAGHSIIGFSATPSSWVNRMLFGVENFISVATTEVTPAIVDQTKIEQSAVRTLAYTIATEKKPLSIVFTETKPTQKDLSDRIKEYDPNITVCILNAVTKTSTEKNAWDYLMQNDSLPTGTNVFILNSVVQSGINIINQDIDSVYLYGTFDPFGFAQYLGRCRHYSKPFQYYYEPWSKPVKLTGGGIEIQKAIDSLSSFVDAAPKEFHDGMVAMMSNFLSIDKDQNLTVNKCALATELFKGLRELGGETLTNAVSALFKDIDFNEEETIEGEVQTPAKSKTKARATGKADLIKFIQNEYTLIIQLFQLMDYDYSETNMVATIEAKYGGKLATLPVLKHRYEKLNEMIKLMRKAQFSPHRLSTAAYLYKNSEKNDEVLNEYVRLSNNTAIGISGAIKFYASFKKTTPAIKKAINELQKHIDDIDNAAGWRQHITKLFPSFTSNVFADGFYKYCLQFKRSSNGKSKLVGINTGLNDYIEHLELEHITVINGKFAPK